jgi:hypothetical protein
MHSVEVAVCEWLRVPLLLFYSCLVPVMTDRCFLRCAAGMIVRRLREH